MGVDYTGHYGIDLQIEPIDFEDEHLSSEIAEFEMMSEFLCEKLEDDRFDWFEVGQGSYTGEDNDFFIEIRDPFSDGIESLVKKEQELRKYIKSLGLEAKGDFGTIGGLEVH